MKRSTVLTLVVVGLVVVLFFYLTTAQASTRCEVCVTYGGRTNCASATGRSEADAREGAQTTACGPLASGMDASIACGRTPPSSVQCRAQ
ncbi:MAG: hypothetical protein ACREMF_06875 [Gemmatimonadales bacterium]